MNDHPKALMDIIDAEVDCTGPRKETDEIMEPRRAMGLARKCRVTGYHGITWGDHFYPGELQKCHIPSSNKTGRKLKSRPLKYQTSAKSYCPHHPHEKHKYFIVCSIVKSSQIPNMVSVFKHHTYKDMYTVYIYMHVYTTCQ